MYDGEVVRLRALRREDLEKQRAFQNDREVRDNLEPGIAWPLRKEDEEKWFDKLDGESEGTYYFAIELRASGEYIGSCGFNDVDQKNRVGIVSIFLGPEYFGRGYGADALRVLVDFSFGEMNLNRLQIHVFAFNERAVRSYEKAGFRREGTLREAIYRHGRYHDEIVMGLLRSEWGPRGTDAGDRAEIT